MRRLDGLLRLGEVGRLGGVGSEVGGILECRGWVEWRGIVQCRGWVEW